jgi:hypothetical protein
MSLLWHIVRKDLRRMAIPVGGWLGFVFLGALWFAFMPRPEGWDPSGSVKQAEFWASFATYIQGGIGFILVGVTVLEDPAAGTTQFWATRPVGARKLFAAKVTSVLLAFVVGPALALSVVWLGSGFGASDFAGAAGRLMLTQALLCAFAFALAALAEDLRQFLGLSLGFGVLSLAFVWGTQSWSQFEQAPRGTWLTRMWIVQWFCLTPLLGFVISNQYLVRRTARTWFAVGAAFVLALGISLGWHGTWMPHGPAISAGQVEVRAARLTGREGLSLFNRARNGPLLHLQVRQLPASSLVAAPLTGIANFRWGNEPAGAVCLWPGSVALPVLTRAVALGEPIPEQVEWATKMGALFRNEMVVPPGPFELDADLTFGLLRPERMGETEAVAGAELVKGSSRLRIVAIETDAVTGGTRGIVIEERDPWTARNPSGWFRRANTPSEWWDGRHDGYVLRFPHSGETVVLDFDERGNVIFSGMRVSYRTLFPSDWGMVRDLTGATLVKVRFHEQEQVKQTMPRQQVPVTLGEDAG